MSGARLACKWPGTGMAEHRVHLSCADGHDPVRWVGTIGHLSGLCWFCGEPAEET